MLVYQRLRALRQARGINQSVVAAHLNISREAYCMYETGKRQPSNELTVEMAKYFGVSMDFLLGLAEVPDSFAGTSSKELFIMRSLKKVDSETLDLLARITRQNVETQSFMKRVSLAAESSPVYGRPRYVSGGKQRRQSGNRELRSGRDSDEFPDGNDRSDS